mmetsp:Transcript_32156/g.48892  ORF Transcript_32156/g.48892 Transcript_32156/m.48892 type:complete len:337 (-) Transcript_32156:170-1180(-)
MSSFCTGGNSPFALLDNTNLLDCDSSDGEEKEKIKIIRGGLTPDHLDLIASRNWKSVLSWIAFHADEVSSFVDREGQSVLHHACLFRAPLDIIEAILFAAPELAKLGNDKGELPLHWAVRLSLPMQVLALLLDANSKSGLVKDRDGFMPLMLLWDRYRKTLVDVYRIYGREKVVSFSEWKLMMMMVEAYTGDSDANNFPLHSIVQCPCDLSFLKFSMEMLHHEIRQKDSRGNLPLHLAACSSPLSADLLAIILDSHPDGAFATDGKGNLPLHLAIASGRQWHEGVNTIFAANPHAIGCRDLQQYLYPFMLAATRDNHSLCTVYELLRGNPEYVRTL